MMDFAESLQHLTGADLADFYGSIHAMSRKWLRQDSAKYAAAMSLEMAVMRELRRRGLGLDGRPTAPVNVSALVD
jgi:hypothetical protein